MNSSDHTTLVAAVKAIGLIETLEGPGPFTVFATTNEAFAMLPAGKVDHLLKPENKPALTEILLATATIQDLIQSNGVIFVIDWVLRLPAFKGILLPGNSVLL